MLGLLFALKVIKANNFWSVPVYREQSTWVGNASHAARAQQSIVPKSIQNNTGFPSFVRIKNVDVL